MKSEIIEDSDSVYDAKYPCIMRNRKYKFTVLFSACTTGVVLTGGNSPLYSVGYFTSDWNGPRAYPEKWEPVNTITIKFEM